METARNFLEVKPPGNLKKPESIQAWRDDPEKQREAWQKFDSLAPWTKLTGAVSRVLAVSPVDGAYFDSNALLAEEATTGEARFSAGARFAAWLLNLADFPEFPGADPYEVAIYGFNPKPLMRLAGMNAIRDGLQIPLGFWYSGADNHCLDPKEMLLESEVKSLYPLRKICAEAPVAPIALPENYRPHVDPETDLRLATELCYQYQLLPKNRRAGLRDLLSPKDPESLSEKIGSRYSEEPPVQDVSEGAKAPEEADKPVKKAPKKGAKAFK